MFNLIPYHFSLVGPIIGQILAAVVPAVLLIIYIYTKDKVEKEPPGLLISLVVLGIVSTFCAMATETVGQLILRPFAYYPTIGYLIVLNFIVVGLSEEGFKFLMLKLRTWKHPAFNYRFDAVVYSVCVSLGFALFENIMYVMQYGMATAAIRAITAVPGHACFSSTARRRCARCAEISPEPAETGYWRSLSPHWCTACMISSRRSAAGSRSRSSVS